jgi:hypothetical protein
MKEINYWSTLDKITKDRIAELSIAISKSPNGMYMRWLQATLESNYNFNLLAKTMLSKIDDYAKKKLEREELNKNQFRANDE